MTWWWWWWASSWVAVARAQLRYHPTEQGRLLGNCSVVREPSVATMLGKLHLADAKLRMMEVKPRLVTANHKTGSFLGMCLARVLSKHGVRSSVASIHASGGFSAHALQVNMVRDPFAIVDSGYLYHGRKSEKWLQIPFEDLVPHYLVIRDAMASSKRRNLLPATSATTTKGRIDENCQAAAAAYVSLRALLDDGRCADSLSASVPWPNETYGDAIARLPTRRGLLLETLRALHRDVPYVVSSARDCAATNTRSSPNVSCVSVLLDDIKLAGYDVAFDSLFAPALGLRGGDALKRDFVAQCDPDTRPKPKRRQSLASRATGADACTSQVHVTSACGGRADRVDIIRDIDNIYLGGALAEANRTISSLARRIRPTT